MEHVLLGNVGQPQVPVLVDLPRLDQASADSMVHLFAERYRSCLLSEDPTLAVTLKIRSVKQQTALLPQEESSA